MSDTENEREGVTFRCEDCGSTVENSPMRPETCVECGGTFEIMTEDVDLPVLLAGVERGDELRLRLEDGSFVEGTVTKAWEEGGLAGISLSGGKNAGYEAAAYADEPLAMVTAWEISVTGTTEERTDLGRVVGVLNLTDHPDALVDYPGERVVLVGCGQDKHDEPMPARLLYKSNYFAANRNYAEQPSVDAWYILSAEYGLVHPDEVIEPYDTHIDHIDTDAWATDVQEALPILGDTHVEVLASADYFEPLELPLDLATGSSGSVEHPVEGMGIPERMKWLGENTTDEDAEQTIFKVGCPTCEVVFLTPEPHIDCPDCGKKTLDRLGFVGGRDLAERVEAADLPEKVDPSRLDATTAREVLERVEQDESAEEEADGREFPEAVNGWIYSWPACYGSLTDVVETYPYIQAHLFEQGEEYVVTVDGPGQTEPIGVVETDDRDEAVEELLAFVRETTPDEARAAIDPRVDAEWGAFEVPEGTDESVEETTLVNMGVHGREGVTPIDRSTQFGNPFRLEKDGGDYSREGSIEAYRVWFAEQLEDDEFHAAVEDLRGETLGCWCKPKACHGDVIVEYLREGEAAVPETAPADPRPSADDTEQATLDADGGVEDQEGDRRDEDRDGCVAVIDSGARGEDYRCGSGTWSTHLLCGTHGHTDPENLRTVFDEDAPADLRIDEYPEVSIGDDRFLAVEQRDGDLLAISIPEYEYVRLEGFGYLVDELDTGAGAGRDEREDNQDLPTEDEGELQEASSEGIDAADEADSEGEAEQAEQTWVETTEDGSVEHTAPGLEPAVLDEHPEGSLVRVELEDGRVYTGEVMDHGTGGWRNDARSLYIDADAVRGSLMVYCTRQADGTWGDLHALDKLIGAYDDPDAGEDGLGTVASIEQVTDEPDREGVLEELVPLLEAGLSPSQALDYWAYEDTETTYGAFTQAEWAEKRGISKQAVGSNVRNARDAFEAGDADEPNRG